MQKNNFIKKNLPIIISFVFWIILSVILIIFVNTLFVSTQEESIGKEKILLVSLLILSLLIAIVFIIYIINLLISVFVKKEFGSRMKLKITIFFIFVALLPIIPFIQIGSKFIEMSMNLWFSKNYGIALDLSKEIVKTYYEEKKEILIGYVDDLNFVKKAFNYDFKTFSDHLSDYAFDKNIYNITIWNKKGEMQKQIGNLLFDAEKSKTDIIIGKNFYLYDNKESIFTLQKAKDNVILLVIPVKIYDSENTFYGFVNISITISPYFTQATTEIDNALRTYNTLTLYKDFFTKGFTILFITIILPIVLIILMMSLFLTNELVGPISNLSHATKRIALGDLKFQVESGFNDEFMMLSKSFNSMIGELEISREKLKQKEKMSTWQDIATQMAHEIKNPLTPIKLSTERLLKKWDEKAPDFQEILNKSVKTILSEVENMNHMLIDFANFSQIPDINKKKNNLISVLKTIIKKHNLTNVTLTSDNETYDILLDENQFENAIINSFELINAEEKIDLFVTEKEIGLNKYAVISIEKKFTVMIEEVKTVDNFVPYFSSNEKLKEVTHEIIKRIIYEHDGRIVFNEIENNKMITRIELPIIK